VAKTLKDHWPGFLNAFDARLTNGRVEAVDSLIQAAKAKARGYGTTKHLITIVYFVAGKLIQLPTSPFFSSRGFPSRLASGHYDSLPTPNAREPNYLKILEEVERSNFDSHITLQTRFEMIKGREGSQIFGFSRESKCT